VTVVVGNFLAVLHVIGDGGGENDPDLDMKGDDIEIKDAVIAIKDAVNSIKDAVNSIKDAVNSIKDGVIAIKSAVIAIENADVSTRFGEFIPKLVNSRRKTLMLRQILPG
jgi:hypothetical protein